MKLYQEARTGKIKWIDITADGNIMRSQWGLMDSDKVQEVEKPCQVTNKGKQNERNEQEQATFEANAKIVKKKEEGYLSWDDLQESLQSEEVPVLLSALPKSFSVCKPISKCPDKVLNGKDTYAQRKHNGHCIILVKDEKGGERVYSRRMEDITDVLCKIPAIDHRMKLLTIGSLVFCEMTWSDNETFVESPRKVAEIVRVKDSAKSLENYIENSKTGRYDLKMLDALWWDDSFIGHKTHRERYDMLTEEGLLLPFIYTDWKTMIASAEAQDWEGFVLRTPDERSCISYSLDGKAHREGSWKYKFIKEDDVVLVGATKGLSGRHMTVYARFDMRQYNDAGELTHYGYCGTGTLKHDELKEMTRQIDAGESQFPMVAEIEFASRQDDSHKFEFPQIQRIRYDKTPEECIFNP